MGKLFGKVYENVTAEGAGFEGYCVVKTDEKTIFVKYSTPGDVLNIRLISKKNKVFFAEIISVVIPGPNRTEPFCSHFGVCGGCKWQQLNYQAQLYCKNQLVYDSFTRLGKIVCKEWQPIIGAQNNKYYRNKTEYTFSNRRWLLNSELNNETVQQKAAGFHISGRFDKVLDIDKCYLQDDFANKIRLFIKNYGIEKNLSFYDIKENKGFLRNIIIRNSTLAQWMIVLITGEDNETETLKLLEETEKKFPEISTIIYGVNTKTNDTIYDTNLVVYKGKGYIEEKLDEIIYRIRPKSFFQTNSEQTLKLYQKIREYADLNGNEIVYDLYCGTGSISLFIARNCSRVYGIESVPQAIEDANENASENKISNVDFFTGDMRFVFSNDFLLKTGKPDIIITDPPRAGMHPDVVSQILKAEATKIVYISCNPSTQARDISMLSEKYEVMKTCPVDMFPHTHHVENVTLLIKK
ncbi:MAG: 23S rRNA (uracil(1939)-C(5))-methyltransferase RlmD [Bacteroidetes bacterium]|nr:23S rRNA (uracil(1939)-C(5))-methyltransferase RlmD [Bacteroidota bacterium]